MRFEFAGLLATLSDNLILGIENEQNLNQEQISQVMSSLFDIIHTQWIISKDSKVKNYFFQKKYIIRLDQQH